MAGSYPKSAEICTGSCARHTAALGLITSPTPGCVPQRVALEQDGSALGELEQLVHQVCADGTVPRDALPQLMVSDAHLGVRGHRDLPQLHVSAEDDPRRGDVVCQVVLRRVDGDAVAVWRAPDPHDDHALLDDLAIQQDCRGNDT